MIGMDGDYYRRRARQAETLAATAAEPAIAAIHRELAARYRSLAGEGETEAPRPVLKLAY